MKPPTLCVVVTRPEPACSRWVAVLQAALATGLPHTPTDAVGQPLLRTEPLSDPAAWSAFTQADARCGALMWVSAAAISSVFDSALPGLHGLRGHIGQAWPGRHWVTGPGTAQALIDRGVPPERIDLPPADAGQYDSEHLWPVVAAQLTALRAAGQGVRIVRGADATGRISGRDWMARQLAAAGVAVEQVAAYQRLPQWSDTAAVELRQREARGERLLWLFSSSEALLAAAAHWPAAEHPHGIALATHPRIADTARQAGWSHVHPTRPALADVIASIKSLA